MVPGSLKSCSVETGSRAFHLVWCNHCAWGDGLNSGFSGTSVKQMGDGPAPDFLEDV